MQKVVTDINGNKYLRQWKPGPKPRGYVKVLVNIPAEYLELMKWKNEECGGRNSVYAAPLAGRTTGREMQFTVVL